MVLNSFTEFLHASDVSPLIGDIDTETLQRFLNDVRTRVSASTVNFHRNSLNAFFADAKEVRKIVASNPVKDIAKYKATKEDIEVSRRPFLESEIRAVYAAAPNDFWRFAIVFGLYTGLRLGNVATLRWREVDLAKRIIEVVDIKSPDKLKIPIESPFLINLFVEIRKKAPEATPESFIFPEYAGIYLEKSKDGENNAATLSVEFRDILVEAKLLEKYQHKNQGTGRSCRRTVSPLSYHSLRHNFVTMLKERGASQTVARELVGHNSDAVNQLYTHTSPEIIRQSLKHLPEVFKGAQPKEKS
jgi:integrase